jgi:3-mercaptopyruvate sulfurtransferase SseA
MKVCTTVTLFAALAMMVSLIGGCSPNVKDSTVIPVSAEGAAKRSEQAGTMIVDTREQARFEAGHIPGARNFRLTDIRLQEQTPELTGHRVLIIYGENPGSAEAMAVAKRLMRAGHSDVRLLDGGFEAWTRAGLPVQR